MEDQKKPHKEDETLIYLTENSSLQTPDEDRRDKATDPRENNTLEPSSDDLHRIPADRAGTDDRES